MTQSTLTTGQMKAGDQTPIFYQIRRPSRVRLRAVIFLVHGLGEHGDRYTYLFDRLLPEGYAFFAPDHRGFGRSGGRRGHVMAFDQYIADLKQLKGLMDDAFPDLPKVIYGHSMGGLITLCYAMAHPRDFDFLVAASPALANPPRAGRLKMAALWLMSLVFPSFSIDTHGDPNGLSRDPAEVRRAVADPLCHGRVSARWATSFSRTQQRVSQHPHRLATDSVLLLQGTGDTKVVPEATRAFFNALGVDDKTYLPYPGFFHELHNDQDRHRVLDDVARWLNQRLAPGA